MATILPYVNKWERRMMDMATLVASWSKDPSTKCGCVIVRPDWTIASVGYNGFPRGVIDSEERYADRPTKYEMVVHSEANAILSAGERLDGCSLFVVPMPPCARCTALIIQAGIEQVVCPQPSDDQVSRWGKSFELTSKMLHEAGVEMVFLHE
jgi:dCMP deaminase